MHLDLIDLRLFIHIAESPSLTKGAKRAFISPAAASARIKALEAQLNSQLLYRGSKGVKLTEAGQRLLKHARQIMLQVGYLRAEFSEYSASSSGHIRVFANTTAVTEFLPEALAGFQTENPSVTIDVQERLTQDIIQGVSEGSTDMGVIVGPTAAKDLQVLRFSTDRLVLVVPKGHLLDTCEPKKLRAALAFHLVGLEEASTLQEFIRVQAEKLGEQLKWRIRVTSFESLCRMVEADIGIGVLPESVATRHSRTMGLSIIQLDETWAVREGYILIRQLEALPSYIRALISTLQLVPYRKR
jgi:DNA-binding transcriptional LysR family regulator